MFSDKNSGVRATSLRVLTKLLRGIKSLPIQELALFPEYLLPGLETLLSESSEENVLLAMAECLPSLAQTAKFFLELAHAERTLLLSSRKSQLQVRTLKQHRYAFGTTKEFDETTLIQSTRIRSFIEAVA